MLLLTRSRASGTYAVIHRRMRGLMGGGGWKVGREKWERLLNCNSSPTLPRTSLRSLTVEYSGCLCWLTTITMKCTESRNLPRTIKLPVWRGRPLFPWPVPCFHPPSGSTRTELTLTETDYLVTKGAKRFGSISEGRLWESWLPLLGFKWYTRPLQIMTTELHR